MEKLYRLVQLVAAPFLLGAQLRSSRRGLLKARFSPPALPKGQRVIWVHTLSLGEVEAALPLLKALRRAFPGYFLVFTVATKSGFERARNKAPVDLVWPGPLDLKSVTKRYLKAFHPEAFILVESDLWPGLLWALKRKGVFLLWANAALSSRSFKRLKRFKKGAAFLLGAFDHICAATSGDAKRLRELLPGRRIDFFGNLKLETEPPSPKEVKRIQEELSPYLKKSLLVAGSTHPGEEEIILEAFKRVGEGGLIICPRKPERAGEVKALAERQGFKASLRSAPKPCEVLVVDTLGELKKIYALGDLSLVGGSLVPIGGHNLLEPLAFGLPILVGPYLESVSDLADFLEREGLLFKVRDAKELSDVWCAVLKELSSLRKRIKSAYQQNKKISSEYVKILKKVLSFQTNRT